MFYPGPPPARGAATAAVTLGDLRAISLSPVEAVLAGHVKIETVPSALGGAEMAQMSPLGHAESPTAPGHKRKSPDETGDENAMSPRKQNNGNADLPSAFGLIDSEVTNIPIK